MQPNPTGLIASAMRSPATSQASDLFLDLAAEMQAEARATVSAASFSPQLHKTMLSRLQFIVWGLDTRIAQGRHSNDCPVQNTPHWRQSGSTQLSDW